MSIEYTSPNGHEFKADSEDIVAVGKAVGSAVGSFARSLVDPVGTPGPEPVKTPKPEPIETPRPEPVPDEGLIREYLRAADPKSVQDPKPVPDQQILDEVWRLYNPQNPGVQVDRARVTRVDKSLKVRL